MNALDWLEAHADPTLREPPFFVLAFTYTNVFRALAAGVPVAQQMPTESDADFVLRYSVGEAFRDGEVIDDPQIDLSIADSGSSRVLTQTRDFRLMFGTAQEPYIWPEPPILRGGTSLILDAVAPAGVEDTRLDLAFHGFKVFFRDDDLRMEFRKGRVGGPV